MAVWLARVYGRCMRNANRCKDLGLEHLPDVRFRSAHRFQKTVDGSAQHKKVLIAIAHHRAGLPRIRAQISIDLLQLVAQ